MAKVASEKKYTTFVKGLITEANALTFPENASLDEDNFDLNIDGSRFRRLGIDYEADGALIPTGIVQATLTETKKSFHRWDFPSADSSVAIGVVRAYNKLWFVNLLNPVPSTALLNGGNPITITGLANAKIETTTINGFFVIVSSDLSWPVVLTYDSITDAVSQTSYPIQVRDFWGVEDNLEINNRPSTLSETHDYNLRNQGWSSQIEAVGTLTGFATWTASHPYVIGDLVVHSSSSYIAYECIIAHTSSGDFYSDYSAGKWKVFVMAASGITPTRVFKLVSGIWSYITQQIFSGIFAVARTKIELDVYPSNTDVWTYGKVGSSTSTNFEKYDPVSLKRNSIDNTEAPKGSYVIDAFKRGYSRLLLTGLTTLPLDEETGKLTTVTSFAGRVCYSGVTSLTTGPDTKSPNMSGSVFFSQIVENKNSLGKCFQEADPTSANISDIVDTDGGMIVFPEVSKIIKLVAIKDSLIVFADNGIWEIYGETGGFKATSFQVSKISNIGISNGSSVVITGSSVLYWSKAGIFVISANPQTGRYETQNISINTIQTFYNSIPDIAKDNAKGFFDEKENHVRWLYNDSVEYTETNNVNHYSKILNLDLLLSAFYKHSISSTGASSPMISDFISLPSFASQTNIVDVYVGNDLVLSGTDTVQITDTTSIVRNSKYSFLSFTGTSFTFSKFRNTDFVDWKTSNGTGANYSSYLVTGYEVFNDVMRNKQIPYIWFYFNRTEDGFLSDGAGGFTAKNPSSCLVQAQWNWANSNIQGKWGQQFQAYRYLRPYIPSGLGDTYDTGDSLIVTKNKFRGSGKAISIKLQSEAGKDMKLLGWAILVTGDGTP